jgi:KDO2-lipid IV(A) lauroyltransferase
MKTPSADRDSPVSAKVIEPRLSLGRTIRHRAEAAVFFSVMALFKILGVDAASALGGAIGRYIYYRLPVINRARENLRLAYPGKTEAEREAILGSMCDSLGRTISEYPHLNSISSLGAHPRIRIIDAAVAKTSVETGRPVIFISGHFANWEVMAIGAYESGFDAATVFRPPNNPYVDRWIATKRLQSGFKEQIAKGTHGMRLIFTRLRRGKIVCFLVDQKTNEGIASPFFGRDAMTTPAPAALALKLNAILQPVSIRRLKGANFEVSFPPAITFSPSGDHDRDIADLTAVINAQIEQQVRKDPAQWLWVHRRWPAERDAVQIAQGKRRSRDDRPITIK